MLCGCQRGEYSCIYNVVIIRNHQVAYVATAARLKHGKLFNLTAEFASEKQLKLLNIWQR